MLKQLKYFSRSSGKTAFPRRRKKISFLSRPFPSRFRRWKRELGFKLLERKNRGFTLTPAGEYFYQKSLILTADYEKMCSAAAKIAKGDSHP